jgi:hypothetical protein
MVDTAGTLCKAAEALKAAGARRVFAFCSHGVLSKPANTRIANSTALTELVILDTIPLSEESKVRRSRSTVICVLLHAVVAEIMDYYIEIWRISCDVVNSHWGFLSCVVFCETCFFVNRTGHREDCTTQCSSHDG